MAENSEISWTDHTANYWWGCVAVSALCDHCYAETLDKRYGGSNWGLDGRRRFIKSVWNDVPKWNALAQRTGERKRVFVMSMGDFFEQLPDAHPDRRQMISTRSKAINLMENCTALDFLVLTKRISNVAKMVPARWMQGLWPRNVRLGISVGTQKDADRDIPRLLEIDCPNFLSMEPLLEPVTLGGDLYEWSGEDRQDGRPRRRIDWVITGGESGPHSRPSHPFWFRSLRDECAAADVPFHLKQWGEYVPSHAFYTQHDTGQTSYPAASSTPPFRSVNSTRMANRDNDKYLGGFVEADCGAWVMKRVGKKAAGRLLDGVTHDGFPVTP